MKGKLNKTAKHSRFIIIIFLTTILACAGYAQTDSLSEKSLWRENQTGKARKKLKQIKTKVISPDQISQPRSLQDSVKAKLNESVALDSSKQKLDSLDQKVKKVKSKADSLNHALLSPFEKAENEVSHFNQKVNQPVDSLQRKINDKLETGRRKITDPIGEAQNNLNSTVQKSAGTLGIKTETIKLPSDVMAESPLKLEGIKNLELKKNEFPGLSSNAKLPSLTDPNLKKWKAFELPQSSTPIEKLNQVNSSIAGIDKKLEKVEKLESDAKKLTEGKIEEMNQLPQELEKQVVAKSGAGELANKQQQIDKYQMMVEKYKDQKLIQQELKSKSLNLANEELSREISELKTPNKQFAKAKKMHGDFKSLKDLPKLPVNEMKGKPFKDRFLPGITLQVFQNSRVIIDVAGQAGYRLSGRLTSGFGITYRMAIQKNYKYYIHDYGVWGGRWFTDLGIAKGLFAHVDFEYLKIDRHFYLPAEVDRSYVAQSNFGIGKRYAISKKIKGSVMGLYRLEYLGHLPSQNKVTIRMGFDLMRK